MSVNTVESVSVEGVSSSQREFVIHVAEAGGLVVPPNPLNVTVAKMERSEEDESGESGACPELHSLR